MHPQAAPGDEPPGADGLGTGAPARRRGRRRREHRDQHVDQVGDEQVVTAAARGGTRPGRCRRPGRRARGAGSSWSGPDARPAPHAAAPGWRGRACRRPDAGSGSSRRAVSAAAVGPGGWSDEVLHAPGGTSVRSASAGTRRGAPPGSASPRGRRGRAADRLRGIEAGGAVRVDHGHVPFDDRGHETAARPEVVLHHRRVALPGGLGHLAQRDAGDAPLGEEALGVVERSGRARRRCGSERESGLTGPRPARIMRLHYPLGRGPVGNEEEIAMDARELGSDALDASLRPRKTREIAPGVHFLAGFGNTTFILGYRRRRRRRPRPVHQRAARRARAPGDHRPAGAVRDLHARPLRPRLRHAGAARRRRGARARRARHRRPRERRQALRALREDRGSPRAHVRCAVRGAGDLAGGDVVRKARYCPPTIAYEDRIRLDGLGGRPDRAAATAWARPTTTPGCGSPT